MLDLKPLLPERPFELPLQELTQEVNKKLPPSKKFSTRTLASNLRREKDIKIRKTSTKIGNYVSYITIYQG